MPDRVKEMLVEIINVYADFLSQDTIDAIADSIIAEGVTVQEWISVKDRLPEKNTSVLGYREGGRCVLFYDRYGFCEIDEYGQDRSVDDVTHWMPLPQPPKGE